MASREGLPSSNKETQNQNETQQSRDEARSRDRERSTAVRRVSESSKLLEECINAREQLDSAMSKIRLSRRSWRGGAMLRTEEGSSALNCSATSTIAVGESASEDEAAAVTSAVPAAREFAAKMGELASVAPGLSALLVAVTGTLGEAAQSTPTTGEPVARGQGTEVPRTQSVDACNDLHEILKVVLPTLAQLLSFDHLRASPSIARNLVHALANLYVRVGRTAAGNVGDGGSQQGGHGSTRSSPEGTPSRSHKSPESSLGSLGPPSTDGSGSMNVSGNNKLQRERMGKKTASWVSSILTQAFAPKVYGGRTVRSSGLDALLGENGVDSAEHHRAVQAEILHNTLALQDLAAEGLAFRRGRRREAGWRIKHQEDSREILFETILKAFGSVLRTGEDEDGGAPAMQLLLARLREDSYRLLAGREIDWEAGDGEIKRPRESLPEGAPLQGGDCLRDQQATLPISPSIWSQSIAASSSGTRRKHPEFYLPTPTRKRRSFLGPFLAPHPLPHEWESRVRDCLAALKHRPFLCPDELLRSTGAVPNLVPEAYTGEAWRRTPSTVDRFSDGFRLSDVCLLLALDVLEEAVLEEGGGELEAGLLRALRTPRIAEVGAETGVGLALAGGGRGHMDGAELLTLVGLLEEAPSGCPKNGLAALAWALEDIGQRYGNSVRFARVGNSSPPAPFLCRRLLSLFYLCLAPPQGLLIETPEQQYGAYAIEPHLAAEQGLGPPHSATITPILRPFEEELWLLLVGYRHWVMVAMVQLLSSGGCASCKAVNPFAKSLPDKEAEMKDVSKPESEPVNGGELAEQAPAHWLLAWYVCGGHAKPLSLLREAAEAMQQAVTCLKGSGSSLELVLEVEEALESAGQSGQGMVGDIFEPCLGVAWLLTSRAALRECERVLARSVLRQEDLEGVFGPRRFSDAPLRSSMEAVLQGLGALEDMVWLAGLQPPLLHVHDGRDLRNLLERVRVWLEGVDGRWRRSKNKMEALTSRGGSVDGDADIDAVDAAVTVVAGCKVLLEDFGDRRDEICRGLASLVAAVKPLAR